MDLKKYILKPYKFRILSAVRYDERKLMLVDWKVLVVGRGLCQDISLTSTNS
jgi:hypothetical protein